MKTAIPLLVLCALLVLPLPAESREMYRYVNQDGNHVIGYQVPPEQVALGYEVLNEKGVLIDVVPPILDDEARADMDAQQRRDSEAEAERKRLQKWDESLLLRYSTIEDIEAARDRALRDLRIRVSILKGKQRSLKQQVENYQAEAADQERRGGTVDESHLKAIDDVQAEISATERSIADRQREIAAVEADYQRDIDRFATLLELVEIRRAMNAQ
ncbi:HlyD family secretion protein [Chromatocurvus halotolerans]|uniref:DUF4124 domain-containing protein n=1 Tax=Chromatocurvus halotolerans TaxID=1132028 RepID=A0A4R2KP33_9GAMM|nr:HlyD family secretion protein [Chromatocurvus halotolerans]TCO75284.1 hypothetical protein EV688_1097 [Chromatocurvus halotolerans]